MTRRKRYYEPIVEVVHPEPRSNVRLLQSEAELQQALCRSAEFDRAIAEKLRHRVDRYGAKITPAAITQIGAERSSRVGDIAGRDGANEPHSA
jgi:hypothetical protein